MKRDIVYEQFQDFIYGMGIGFEWKDSAKYWPGTLIAVNASRQDYMENLQEYMSWVFGGKSTPKLEEDGLKLSQDILLHTRTYYFPRFGMEALVNNKEKVIGDGYKWGFIHEETSYFKRGKDEQKIHSLTGNL